MIHSIAIKEDFCEHADLVRQSALDSGFGTWAPNKGAVGSSNYDGMSFYGRHGLMVRALSDALGVPVFPNAMFFRVTTPETEAAYIHSDRQSGGYTCVAYLSRHDEVSGTAFYRHKKTGLTEMPTFAEMQETGTFEMFKRDMVEGNAEPGGAWEQLDFVRGLFNRAVIFYAPLFHSRVPLHGIGAGDPATARMVWVCHFDT